MDQPKTPPRILDLPALIGRLEVGTPRHVGTLIPHSWESMATSCDVVGVRGNPSNVCCLCRSILAMPSGDKRRLPLPRRSIAILYGIGGLSHE